MTVVSGLIYKDGEFTEGHVEFDDLGILSVEDGLASAPDISGIILPRFINSHTHLGDSAVPKPEKGRVEEIVAPPDGYKHRMLRRISEEEQIDAMASNLEFMYESGTSHHVDFREGGIEGVRTLTKSALGSGVTPIIFGRPGRMVYNPEEMEGLLACVDGIGLSGARDWEPEHLDAIVDHVRRENKPLAFHASECVHEDFDLIAGYKPAFLIHMIEGSDEDFKRCADSGIPIVVCPRANSFFDLRPPVERMLNAGVDVCLGTDNAMLAKPDMFEEMHSFRSLVSESVLSDLDVIKIVFENTAKVLSSIFRLGGRSWGFNGFMILEKPPENPCAQILGASASDIRLILNWR